MDSSKGPAKSSPHSRFIPREEIADVAAWHFSAIGGVTEPAPLAAAVEASEPVVIIDQQAIEEARAQAYAEGYAQGHETGSMEVREALGATVAGEARDTATIDRSLIVMRTVPDADPTGWRHGRRR